MKGTQRMNEMSFEQRLLRFDAPYNRRGRNAVNRNSNGSRNGHHILCKYSSLTMRGEEKNEDVLHGILDISP
jgi:hypothetical protein